MSDLISAGQSVCMTTHSMVDCEALCTRVGIMVNGSLCCLGTPQELKSAYGKSYILKIRTNGPLQATKELVGLKINNAVIKVSVL